MKKILTGALAALTMGGAALATATPAAAQWRGGYHGGWHHGWHGGGAGWAVGAGLLGLAVGAAIASDHPRYYYAPPPPYYVGPAYYGYYGGCRTHWRWDPYWGRYVQVTRCY